MSWFYFYLRDADELLPDPDGEAFCSVVDAVRVANEAAVQIAIDRMKLGLRIAEVEAEIHDDSGHCVARVSLLRATSIGWGVQPYSDG